MKKLMIVRSKTALAGLALVLASAIPGSAAVIHVPADYSTIQAAVDAAKNHDTIRIAAGVYEEQVVIADKTLTLSGSPGAVLRATPNMQLSLASVGSIRVPLVGIVLATNVVVSGLTFEGEELADSQPGPLEGIFFLAAGGRVVNCRIEGFRGSTLGSNGDVDGVYVGNPPVLGAGVVNVQVVQNTFADNVESVELIGGHQGPVRILCAVNDNIITGNGPDTTGMQNGIVIQTGVQGEVKRNIIADHAYKGTTAADPFSFGILAIDAGDFFAGKPLRPVQPVQYEGNIFRNNQIDLFLVRADGSMIVNNSFEGTAPSYRPGGIVFSGENVKVVANRFNNMETGLLLLGKDRDFGTYFGIASNANVVANRFCEVDTPIEVEDSATGKQAGNKLDACH